MLGGLLELLLSHNAFFSFFQILLEFGCFKYRCSLTIELIFCGNLVGGRNHFSHGGGLITGLMLLAVS
jgi:hypothetical protein